MRIRKFHILFVLGVVAAAFVGAMLFVSNLGEVENEATAFVTLGLQALPGETSSYEIQRATEHFSYIVLGWTIEPAFADEVAEVMGEGFSFGARSQEKQSLIFTVSAVPGLADDVQPAEDLLNLVEMRIDEYNSATEAEYVVAVERFSFQEGSRSEWRIVLGVMLLSFVLAILGLSIFERLYADSSRSSRSA